MPVPVQHQPHAPLFESIQLIGRRDVVNRQRGLAAGDLRERPAQRGDKEERIIPKSLLTSRTAGDLSLTGSLERPDRPIGVCQGQHTTEARGPLPIRNIL